SSSFYYCVSKNNKKDIAILFVNSFYIRACCVIAVLPPDDVQSRPVHINAVLFLYARQRNGSSTHNLQQSPPSHPVPSKWFEYPACLLTGNPQPPRRHCHLLQ